MTLHSSASRPADSAATLVLPLPLSHLLKCVSGEPLFQTVLMSFLDYRYGETHAITFLGQWGNALHCAIGEVRLTVTEGQVAVKACEPVREEGSVALLAQVEQEVMTLLHHLAARYVEQRLQHLLGKALTQIHFTEREVTISLAS